MTIDVQLLRRVAAERTKHAQACFESLTSEPSDVLSDIDAIKLASVEDHALLVVAEALSGDTLETYEKLGGTYKVAFGTPMFSPATKITAAPAVAAAPRVGTGTVSPAAQTPSVPSVPDAGMGSVGQ